MDGKVDLKAVLWIGNSNYKLPQKRLSDKQISENKVLVSFLKGINMKTITFYLLQETFYVVSFPSERIFEHANSDEIDNLRNRVQ